MEDGKFIGRARVFDSEAALIAALEQTPGLFADKDMVVIRYEGPRGAPGMPEMLDPTSRITALCRLKNITIGLMTDARFSGGSVGLVVGHVSPEAYLGGPIALIEEGDTIVVDIDNDRWGWAAALGVGVEYFVAPNIAFGLETRYLTSRDHRIRIGTREDTGHFDAVTIALTLRVFLAQFGR